MKKIILALFIPVVAVLSAFEQKPALAPVQYRVKSITNLLAGKTTEYYYTPDKNISEVKSPNGRINYQYFKEVIVKSFYDSSAHRIIVDTFFLNDYGLVSTIHPTLERADVYDQLEYDKNGFRIVDRMYYKRNVSSTTLWLIAEGNEKKCMITYSSPEDKELNSTVYYTYYTDEINTIGNENTGMKFSGQSPRNLLKDIIRVNLNGDTTAHVNLKYYFDDKGRVKQKVEFNNAGAMLDSLAYTYY